MKTIIGIRLLTSNLIGHSNEQSVYARMALALGTAMVYAVTFLPLQHILGNAATALSVLPVAVAGWYFGQQAGLLAGLLNLPLTVLLVNLAEGAGRSTLVGTAALPGMVVAVVIGLLVGRMRGLSEQMRHELARREQTEAALRSIEVQNRALLAQTQRRLKEQVALREASIAISSSLELDEILALVTEKTAQMVGACACAISEWDCQKDVVVALAYYLAPKVPVADLDLRRPYRLADYPAIARVLRERRPLTVYADDPAADAAEGALLKSLNFGGVFIVPMVCQERVIGVMEVYLCQDGPYQFIDDVAGICQALANQAAVAIENARLYEEAQRRDADMMVLYTISQMATRSLVLEDVLSQVLRSALTLLDFRAGLVSLADATDGRLQRVVEHGLPSILSRRQRTQLVDALCRYAYDRQETFLVDDLEQAAPSDIHPVAAEMPAMGLRACACIPLVHHDQRLGVMVLFAPRPRTFTLRDRTTLDTIGHQLATAVANARLFQAMAGERGRLQALIEASPTGIILVGTDMRLLVANTLALELLGLPGGPGDWASRPLQDALAALRRRSRAVVHAALTEMRRLRDGDDSPGDGECETVTHTICWLSLPVKVGSTPAGRLLMLRDVTEERLLEEMREDLIHTMVHDLRSPLTAISGALELLEHLGEDMPTRQLSVLQLVQQSTQKMMKLVNDILEVSRLEAKQMPLERQPLSMTSLITDTLRVQSGRALEKGLHLESDLPPTLPPAYADPELIERVLQNLVDNAIKFTPPGGRVRLSAQPMNGKYVGQANGHAGQLRISVSDEGPGIPRPLRSQLFQKFVTGGQPESGSGLGLAFCRLAVEAHGGHIWAESEPGRGATFAFTLPVACN